MTDKISGGCLCGAVRYEIEMTPDIVAHCYCVDCRKTSGTGHATLAIVPEPQFSVDGEMTFFDAPADSGNVVSRGFCGTCGCPILSKNTGMPGMLFPRMSSLDDPDSVTPSMAVYTSRAPAWDKLDEDLTSFAEMPEGGPPNT